MYLFYSKFWRREYNIRTHLAFIDLVKAFDFVNRKMLYNIMKHQGYPEHVTEVIETKYVGSKIIINTGNTKTAEIVINKAVRQECPLSPTLFNIRINGIVQKMKRKIVKGIKLSKHKILNIILYAEIVCLNSRN
ncbi:MAG: reverse transcriptase domain-containing protein [Arsenophonus sp. NC-LC2-MAG3]